MTLTQKERDAAFYLIGRYTAICEAEDILPVQSENGMGSNHCYWLLLELQKELIAGNPKFDDGKVGRWIGYIQSWFIQHGIGNLSVQSERDISRPLYQRKVPDGQDIS